MKNAPARNSGIDILRCAALFLVIGRHLVPLLDQGGHESLILEGWQRIGWLGVDLFFVISGYLISGLIFNEHRETGDFSVSRFLIRRGLKIYPAYFVFLFYVMFRLGSHDGWGKIAENWPSMFLIQNYVSPNTWGHTWSLAVEEHFYLIFAFGVFALLKFYRSKWRANVEMVGVFVLMAALALRLLAIRDGVSMEAVYSQTHFRIDALMIGVLLRMGVVFYGLNDHKSVTPVLAAVAILPWVAAFYLPWGNHLMMGLGMSVFPWSAAALVMIVTKPSFKFPGAIFLSWIGRNSYSSYLWHMTAIGWSIKLGVMAGLPVSVLMILSISMIVGLGAFMTILVEAPVLRIRERFFPSTKPPARPKLDFDWFCPV